MKSVDPPAGAVLKTSFAPVVDRGTRLLILGSLPGERSLAAGEYYAHPQNQFWRLLGAVLGVELTSLDYGARLACLRAHGIGLWDVIGRAQREGSLDSALRGIEDNDLARLLAGLPALRGIAFNGGTAARIGRRALAGVWSGSDPISLPSSSAAHASLSFERKLDQWQALGRRGWLTS